ncbi:MAG: chemotaxis protein CheW [Caulobacteraceae bacterium]|nr:chemotaxis protein CheW [Caulobacteraceae bacterium]
MNAAATTGQFLTFFVGEEQFAAPAAKVSEVFRRPRITRVPNGPHSLLGLAGLRGAPAPVISLARLLGREDTPGPAGRLLMLDGEQPVGLAVDRVGTLAAMPLAAPSEDRAEDGGRAGLGRLYLVEGAALRMLDLDGLLRREFGAEGRGRGTRLDPGASEARERAAEPRNEIALLSFEVAGQAYALPLDEVAEVMPLPSGMASIAQSDEAALGVAELRGRLLPVISLRRLLGLPAGPAGEGRVVVARIGQALVGLAADRLKAILRMPAEAIDAAPAALNRGRGEAQVQSICRLPGQGGLVAVLSGERLFRDEKLAHVLGDGRSEDEAMETAAEETMVRLRFLIFRLGGEEYGLPLEAVDEVARLPERLTRLPNAPAFVEGVMTLRGRITPVIDQRVRFDADQAGAGSRATRPRVVLTTVAGRQAGFIVDAVTEIMGLGEADIDRTPSLAADAGRLFHGIATLDAGSRLILLVDPKEMLDRAERDLLAAFDASRVANEA